MPRNGSSDLDVAADLFKVLSAPLRLGILDQLDGWERCVHELVEALHAPQPLISQHLRVLRGARLVRSARRGREIAYELSDDHVAHIVRDALTHTREDAP